MKTRLVLALAVFTGGCAHYAPLPVDTRAAAVPIVVDASAVHDMANRIASPRAQVEGWDRVDLLAAGLLTNRTIMAARSAVISADAGVQAAKTPPAPGLTLTSEYAKAADGSSPWLLSGLLNLPLDIGAPRQARITSARLAALTARYDLAEAIWTMRMDIRRALAERFIALRQQPLLAHEVTLRMQRLAGLERRRAAGEIDRSEVERARAELADADRRASAAKLRAEQALNALSAATGTSRELLQAQRLVWSEFDDPAQPGAVPDTAGLLIARADVLRAVTAYDNAENGLRSAVAAQWPSISLQPGYTWERGLVKLPFGLGINLPPIDLNRRNIAAAEAARAEAGKRLEAVVAAGYNALRTALSEATQARAELARVRQVDLPTADRLAALAESQFRGGAIDRPELIAAQTGRISARLAELDALARVHAADAAVEDALRRPLEGPEQNARWQGDKM